MGILECICLFFPDAFYGKPQRLSRVYNNEKDFTEVLYKKRHMRVWPWHSPANIEVMKKLGLVSGDVIEIQGKKKAAAIVWPRISSRITGMPILPHQQQHRRWPDTGIDEKVRINAELNMQKKW